MVSCCFDIYGCSADKKCVLLIMSLSVVINDALFSKNSQWWSMYCDVINIIIHDFYFFQYKFQWEFINFDYFSQIYYINLFLIDYLFSKILYWLIFKPRTFRKILVVFSFLFCFRIAVFARFICFICKIRNMVINA